MANLLSLFPSLLLAFDLLILVDISDRKLYLMQNDNIIRQYEIAVPRYRFSKTLEGEVVKIEKNPWWYPTENIRREYKERTGKELPEAIPPGDPRNAMGVAKLIIRFYNSNQPFRIHGTNQEESIGRAVTHGCIRLKNKDVLDLIEKIENKKVKVVIQE
jgi:lipoprotein-anchoring transpeptidase ErfK/SrfK